VGKYSDEMTTGEAAKVLQVHPRTLTRWVKDAFEGAPSPVQEARRSDSFSPSGQRFYLPEKEVRRLARLFPGSSL
jgi:DNA-binding transcriptional MerR regulator